MELGKKKSLLKYFLPPSCSSSSLLRCRRPRRIIGSKVVGRLAAAEGEREEGTAGEAPGSANSWRNCLRAPKVWGQLQ